MLVKQEVSGHIVTSTYKNGKEITIETVEFDGCDGLEVIDKIIYIDRDECIYNFNGEKYKKTLKEYKEMPEEDRILSGGFGDIQIGECYKCDYCNQWGKTPQEEKEIIKAINKQMKEDYGL